MKKNLLFFVILLSGFPVFANPYDFFNTDPFSKSLAGSNSLINPLSWTSAATNPASLSETSSISMGFSYSYANLGLTVNGQDANLLDYKGFDVGFAIPLKKYLKYPMFFGATIHMPDQFVARVQSVPASEPRFIFYDNYPHRLVVALGVSFKPLEWLSLGIGSDVFLDLQGDNLHIFVGSQAGKKIGEMGIETTMPVHQIPNAGIIIKALALPKPLNTLKFGVFYREPYVLNANLNIVSDIDIANVVTGDTLIFLKSTDHYSPRKVSLGLSWSIPRLIDVYAGLNWYEWSAFTNAQTSVRLSLDFGINPPMINVDLPDNNFKNTLSPSLGFVFHSDKVLFSMGYAYRPSPIPNQDNFTTLMDNDVHILGLGLSVPINLSVGSIPFVGDTLLISHCKRIYFGYQFQHFSNRKTDKKNPTFENVFYGGQIHQLSLGVEYKF